MAVDAEPGAFFAPEGDPAPLDELADVLEADRGFMHGHPVVAGHGVHQVSGGHAAGHRSGPVRPGFEQVVEQQGQDVVGGDEGAVVVEHPEAVGIPVGREAEVGAAGGDLLPELLQDFIGRFGRMAAEENVPVAVDGVDFDAALAQEALHRAHPGAVERVEDHLQAAALQRLHGDFFFECFQVGQSGVDLFHGRFFSRLGPPGRRPGVQMFRGQLLELASDLGQGGRPVGGGELQPVVFGGVVAGGEVDAAVGLPAPNFVGDGRGGRGFAAEKALDLALAQHPGRLPGEFRGKESSVVADDQPRAAGIFLAHVVGDGVRHAAHGFESEIFGDDAAPAGGAEMNFLVRHSARIVSW